MQESESFLPTSSHFLREYAKHIALTNKSIQQRNQIEFLGPSGISGRMISIALNPKDTNELWVGSASGGLWRSDSAGRGKDTWKFVPLGYPVNSISAIAISPFNTKTIYIGTGEVYSFTGTDGGVYKRTLRGSYGIGLLKSIDGGLHWNVVSSLPMNHHGINKIVFHPFDSNQIYVACSNGLYKSEDGGKQWNFAIQNHYISDLLIHKDDSLVVFAGIGGHLSPDYNIYKSIDGGKNWKPMLDQYPHNNGKIMLAAYAKNKNLMYAILSDTFETTHILRSKTQFETHTVTSTKDIATYQGWYASGFQIKEDDSTLMVAGGVDLFLDKTGYANGFYNLLYDQLKYHVDFHGIISNPKDPRKLYFVTDGGVFRSNNFCKTIFPINDGLLTGQFYYGSVSQSVANYYVGGMQDNRTAIFEPHTTSWRNIHYGDGTANAIVEGDQSMLYCASQNLEIYKSQDTGTTWRKILNRDLNTCFISKFILSKWDKNVLFAGGVNLLITKNGGETWETKMNPEECGPIVTLYENDYVQEGKIYFSTTSTSSSKSKIFSYDLKKNQFKNITQNLPNRNIRDITSSPIDPSKLYIVMDGYATQHVYQSNDEGESWEILTDSLPDVPHYSIHIDPKHPEIIYVGNEYGLYVSRNNGKAWENIALGEFDIVKIYDIQYSPIDNKIILFTHGNGVIRMDAMKPSIPTSVKSTEYNFSVLLQNKSIYVVNPSNGKTTFELFDQESKLRKRIPQNTWMSVSDLASGIYFIRNSGCRNCKAKKLVIF